MSRIAIILALTIDSGCYFGQLPARAPTPTVPEPRCTPGHPKGNNQGSILRPDRVAESAIQPKPGRWEEANREAEALAGCCVARGAVADSAGGEGAWQAVGRMGGT